MSDQSVIVYFQFTGDDFEPLYTLEDELATVIDDAGAGEYDGHEVALLDGNDGFLFMSGADADKLFAVIKPVLERCLLMAGAEATLRHGSPDDPAARETHVMITTTGTPAA